jgi:hypothetical protein
VPAGPAETLAYICTHLPAGTLSTTIFGGLQGPNVPENEIGALAVPGNPGSLVIQAVRLPNGSSALRADAQVVWITARSPSETIPAGAKLLRIAVHAHVTQALRRGSPRHRHGGHRARQGCVHTVTVARLTRKTEPEGEDAIAFSGKVDGRALKRGRYAAMLSARDTGGRSGVAGVEFEITR